MDVGDCVSTAGDCRIDADGVTVRGSDRSGRCRGHVEVGESEEYGVHCTTDIADESVVVANDHPVKRLLDTLHHHLTTHATLDPRLLG